MHRRHVTHLQQGVPEAGLKTDFDDCDLSTSHDDSNGGALDWYAFQHERMRDSVERTHFFRPILASCIIFDLVFISRGELTDGVLVPVSLVLAATCTLHLIARWWLKVVRSCQAGTTRQWYVCVTYQVLSISALFLVTLRIALQRELEVKVHRVFITGYLGTLFLAIELFYMPLRWQVAAVSLPAMCAWAYFHLEQGMVTAAVLFWGLIFPGVELWYFKLVEQREWSLFKLIRQQKRARVLSDALEEALRGMLSSVFDASCECNGRGTVISSSPHLQDLLGSTGSGLVGLDFADLAANPTETQRISAFLAQCAGAAKGPAARIETSLSRADDRKAILRLTLCCVTLPTDGTGLIGQRLLIGFQRAQSEQPVDMVHLPSGGPAFALGLGEMGDDVVCPLAGDHAVLFSLPDATHAVSPSDAQGEPAADGDFDSRSLLSYTWTQPSVCAAGTIGIYRAGRAGDSLPEVVHTKAAATQTECQCSEPVWTQSLLTGREVSRQEVSCQTSPLTAEIPKRGWDTTRIATAMRPRPPRLPHRLPAVRSSHGRRAHSADPGVLNLFAAVEAATEARAAVARNAAKRYSSFHALPCPDSKRSPEKRLASDCRRGGSPNASNSMLRHFSPTKAATVWFIVEECMEKIYSGGKGCCHWHGCANMLAHTIGLMAAKPCRIDFTPKQGWQCMMCGGLNDPEEGDAVEWHGDCDVCGEEAQQRVVGGTRYAAENSRQDRTGDTISFYPGDSSEMADDSANSANSAGACTFSSEGSLQ